jgi:hypothetical protein
MREELIGAAEGALGGAVGTLFMQGLMKASARLPPALSGPEIAGDPGEHLLGRLERRTGRLPERTRKTAAHGLPWAYGTFWGAALGLLAPRLRLRRWSRLVTAGAAMGAAVWAIGYVGWLPATGLAKPIHRQGALRSLSALVCHASYGVVAALPLGWLERRRYRAAL